MEEKVGIGAGRSMSRGTNPYGQSAFDAGFFVTAETEAGQRFENAANSLKIPRGYGAGAVGVRLDEPLFSLIGAGHVPWFHCQYGIDVLLLVDRFGKMVKTFMVHGKFFAPFRENGKLPVSCDGADCRDGNLFLSCQGDECGHVFR